MATRDKKMHFWVYLEEYQMYKDYAQYRGLDVSSMLRLLVGDSIRQDTAYQQQRKP